MLILIFLNLLYARVFNFGNERFAPYFKGNLGLSQLGKEHYEGISGSQTVFNSDPTYIYSGELGFLFSHNYIGISFGVEFLSPEKMEIEGLDSGGTQLLDLESTLRATNLKSTVYLYVYRQATYRSYLGLSGSMSTLKLENAYTLTTDGQALYGFSDYALTAEASSISYEFLLGFEFLLSDTNTLTIEGGYRHLVVDEWEYSSTGSGFVSHTQGQPVVNSDGTALETDLGGVFIGLTFKLYVK